jgi:hypothetical protein
MLSSKLESSTEAESVKWMKLHNLIEIAALVANVVSLDLFVVELSVQLVSHGRIQELVQLQ